MNGQVVLVDMISNEVCSDPMDREVAEALILRTKASYPFPMDAARIVSLADLDKELAS